jgi:hypothetical protein
MHMHMTMRVRAGAMQWIDIADKLVVPAPPVNRRFVIPANPPGQPRKANHEEPPGGLGGCFAPPQLKKARNGRKPRRGSVLSLVRLLSPLTERSTAEAQTWL